ncbi:hypothetical protein DUNSADRAFT_17875 [Dunaliella salina]|uniref:Encoded protein n=1 Tax=Dunaliella salina TaxID=3046 RepID=A0ABQ7G0Y2_DUNSA|nr:hypothetical protein DUNSADRAFT_17875 [Dunaliella salina]|eukprot:KAF5828267.1 hypothetical protein DUNSADRAFT_17875 [Dunaliella salina]
MSRQPSPSSPTFPSPLSRPYRSSLPTNFRQSSKTFSHGSSHRKSLPTNFRQASKTFTHGSSHPNFASRSQTPTPAASVVQWTPEDSKATVFSTDTASLSSMEEPQDQLGTPGLGVDLTKHLAVGDGPQFSAGASFSPCFAEALSPGISQSPLAAEGKTGSQTLSEDAVLHSFEDLRSVHIALSVAAELGEDVPQPCEEHGIEKVETCTNSSLLLVGGEAAHTAAKPCARYSRHSTPGYGPHQGKCGNTST